MKTLRVPLLLALVGCMPVAPAPPTPRVGTDVQASAGKSWDAVIDLFAARNIPIRNMERVSGLIVTEQLSIAREEGLRLADCGKALGMALPAVHASYNVLVRGDSTKALVRVTTRFTNGGGTNAPITECSSRGLWEADFETAVKARAEGRAASSQ